MKDKNIKVWAYCGHGHRYQRQVIGFYHYRLAAWISAQWFIWNHTSWTARVENKETKS